MSVPNELPDIGSTAQRLRQNPRFDPVAGGIGPEDYFVWTRFDGATTLRDLILMTGLATPRAVDIVRKLRTIGAIFLPGERPESVTIPARSDPPRPDAQLRRRTDGDAVPTEERTPFRENAADPNRAPLSHSVSIEDRTTTRVLASELRAPGAGTDPEAVADAAVLDEDVELSPEERRRILAMHHRVRSGDGASVLGVGDAADKKAIKRAYFALSKEFHPDRYYGKRTGSYGARLTEIFEAVSRTYASLSEDRPRRARSPSPDGLQAQSPVDHAADLFDRACQAEVSGDRKAALRLFEGAIRVHATARYLRRAARCALAAGENRQGLEYARKAANLEPNDPSTARVLAQAFKATGRLDDAEEVLVLALMMKTENDQLVHELQADLADIRQRLTR